MSERRGKTEILVGLFLVLGFVVIGSMAILFGKTGEGSKTSYRFTVEFPNASGLAKGANVLLAGANIGLVATAPKLNASDFRITVDLAIREDVRLPHDTKFIIGSSGLLGDKFVDVQLPPKFDLNNPLKAGDYIAPSRASGGGGFSELTDKGAVVMDRLVVELEHIEALTQRLNEGLLHDRNLKNIEDSFANLRVTTERFKDASERLEGVVAKAGTVLETTEGSVKAVGETAARLQDGIEDMRKMLGQATKAVDNTSALMKKAAEGGGPLGTLINDKKMADDLKALAANLRRSGVLFYKDRPAAPAASPAASPAPVRGAAPRR